MNDEDGETTCPCMYCGRPTTFTATEKCGNCWTMERAMRADMPAARYILAKLEEEVRNA